MENEYDFSGAERGRFYRPGQPKRYVVTCDLPRSGTFEVFLDEAVRSVEEFRESVIGAKVVVSG